MVVQLVVFLKRYFNVPIKFNNSSGTGIFFIFCNISGWRSSPSLKFSWSIIENLSAALCSSEINALISLCNRIKIFKFKISPQNWNFFKKNDAFKSEISQTFHLLYRLISGTRYFTSGTRDLIAVFRLAEWMTAFHNGKNNIQFHFSLILMLNSFDESTI